MENFIDNDLPFEKLKELEDQRIQKLDDAGVNEEDVLNNARENMQTWRSYNSENDREGMNDANFVYEDQWTAREKAEFNRLFVPALTVNKCYKEIKKIVGEQRKNKPDLLVRSMTGKASQDQINLRADIVRSIAYHSQTDLVYQTAATSALVFGYGAFYVYLDYEKPRSFKQIPRYGLIKDASKTSFDPSATQPHKGDGNWCSMTYTYSKDEFYATWPYISDPVSYSDPRSLLQFEWETRDSIVVCTHSAKEWYPLIIYKLSNGLEVSEDEWDEMQKDIATQKALGAESVVVGGIINKMIPTIVRERQTQDYRIMQYHMTQNKIIDFEEWPSKHLPIIYVDGDSAFVNGKQRNQSYIRQAKDSQRLLNYMTSQIAGDIKNRRREQWIATPDNIRGNEQMWRNPEMQLGALIANPDGKTGLMPQKTPGWDMSPAMLQTLEMANQTIRECLGSGEANDTGSRDISGKAKRERRLDVSAGAEVFMDNMTQSVEQGARVVNDLINYCLGDDERNFNVKKKDGKTESIVLNKVNSDGSKTNVVEAGEFDVEIDVGPSFAVQQEIALEFLQQTIQAAPQYFNLIADLWAKNLDVQFMPQMAERFKTIVPEAIIAKEEGKPVPPPKPNPQEIMMQMEMKNQQADIAEKAEGIKLRRDQHQLDRERHELEKLEMMLKARELQAKLNNDGEDRQAESHKTDLDYSAKIAKVLADLHKGNADRESKKQEKEEV